MPTAPSTTSPEGVIPERSEEDFAAHLKTFWAILHHRRWIALGTFFIVMLADAVYLFRTTPIFRGRTRILIERENPRLLDVQDVYQVSAAASDYYQTQYK